MVELVEMVRVAVCAVAPDMVTVAGEKAQLAPEGRPLQAKETVPASPFAGVTVRVDVPLAPGWTVNVEGEDVRANDGGTTAALTVKLCATCGAAA